MASDMDIDLVTKDSCGGESLAVPVASSDDRDSEEELVFVSPLNKERLGLGLECSTPEPNERKRERGEEEPTPEPNERKRERGEEEPRRLEERSLKSEERLESGVESNCDCWVVSRNGGATERRSDAYRGSAMCLSFVPNHRYNPNVRFLGTSIDSLPLGSEGFDPDWESHLVTPTDHMTHIPSSPALPLFSLIRFSDTTVVVDGVMEIRSNGVIGISYSLPIHPPHSHLIPSVHHPFPTLMIGEKMIGSCNGLYCLRSTLHDEEYDWFEPSDEVVPVTVWNPTGLSRELPPCRHPLYDGLVFGFGYDHHSDDYKVVKIDAATRLVEVFSLYSNSNNCWRSVQGLPRNISNVQRHFSHGAVSFEGCLNWLVSSAAQNMVASFNLTTESFRFLPLPPSRCLDRLSLCILDGCLSFASLYDASRDRRVSWCIYTVLDVWIMREYEDDSSWTNVASLVFPHCIYTPYRILYLSKDVLILAMEDTRPFVFNLKENSLVCPHICGAVYNYRGFEPYVQSKVSPYCRDGYEPELPPVAAGSHNDILC